MRRLTAPLADQQIAIELSNEALEKIAESGFDQAYGARPLKRTLQKKVLDPIATRLLEGQLAEGGTVLIGVSNGSLTIDLPAAA